MVVMGMTLRLTDAEAEALRRRAELEQRPVQEVVRQAIREYVERNLRAERSEQAAEESMLRWAELLERLRNS
jgi:predicted transcriptional regulator